MAEQIKDLGAGGLNTDLPPMIVPMNTFTDVLNVRFNNNSIETITGETTNRIVSNTPDFGVHWRRPDQGYNIFGKNGSFVRVDSAGSEAVMLNSVDAKYSDSDWHSTYFNGGYAVIINNGTSTPLYCLYNDVVAGSTFQELPNWNYVSGLTVTAKVVRALNYSLVAANLTLNQDSVITNAPGTIRISVQAPTGSIPTVWQPGTTTDTADEFELSSTSPILDMLELRGNLFVYSSDSISIVALGNVTKVSKYSNSYGILSTDCVVEFDGKHFVVDRNDIYIHSGSGEIQSISEYRVKDYFFNNLNKSAINKVKVIRNTFNKEVWINYPKGDSLVCNEALIYNYKNNTWTKRVLPSVTYTFNGPSNVTNQFQYGTEVIYFTTDTTQTLVTDNGHLMWNGSALASFDSYIEKRKLNTGDLMGSTAIKAIYPVFDNVPAATDINISVLSQNNYIDNPAYTSTDVYVFEPDNPRSQGYKVDPRTNGRVLNYKIQSTGYWRLCTFSLDAKPIDRR